MVDCKRVHVVRDVRRVGIAIQHLPRSRNWPQRHRYACSGTAHPSRIYGKDVASASMIHKQGCRWFRRRKEMRARCKLHKG